MGTPAKSGRGSVCRRVAPPLTARPQAPSSTGLSGPGRAWSYARPVGPAGPLPAITHEAGRFAGNAPRTRPPFSSQFDRSSLGHLRRSISVLSLFSSFASPSPSSSELRNQAEHAQDLPTSPRLAAIGGGPGAFWGGQVGAAGFGVTPGEQEHEPRAQPNSGPLAVAASKGQVLSQLNGAAGGFDSFSDVNPFTLKTLDAYRMQLRNRAATQAL
ncbi:hypothetical protein DFH11DRAFT_1877741 [Phellopilus nigrolimitatus]|nr:hypothetical protein DFH11DRAFT_1877741 [Phellopilus nigrolimitatus]